MVADKNAGGAWDVSATEFRLTGSDVVGVSKVIVCGQKLQARAHFFGQRFAFATGPMFNTAYVTDPNSPVYRGLILPNLGTQVDYCVPLPRRRS